MLEATCHQCGVVFHAQRRTAKFCDDACRKANHETTRRGKRKREPQNRSTSHTQARREDEFFDRHMRMCEAYYGRPPTERPEYLLGLIAEAREGNRAVRRILTNYVLLRPHDLLPNVVHWRGTKNYPTIAQEAHAFCKQHFGYGIAYVIENPCLAPSSQTMRQHENEAERESQERLVKIYKHVLPSLQDRPDHVVRAFAGAVLNARSARFRAEDATASELNLPFVIEAGLGGDWQVRAA